jgi:peptide subunit release factor 1 (eRF1)
MDKFLRHIDNGLDLILQAYHLPLFVMGTQKIMGHFKKLTKHGGAVIEYIHGNFEETPLKELREILEPHITNWKKVKQKDFLNQLEEARNNKKLAIGMTATWNAAMNHRGKLLLVEKNYMYAAQFPPEEMIKTGTGKYNKYSYIKDAVDAVIEKVLESGGDVEFIDRDLLHEYQHIALIEHY